MAWLSLATPSKAMGGSQPAEARAAVAEEQPCFGMWPPKGAPQRMRDAAERRLQVKNDPAAKGGAKATLDDLLALRATRAPQQRHDASGPDTAERRLLFGCGAHYCPSREGATGPPHQAQPVATSSGQDPAGPQCHNLLTPCRGACPQELI